MEIHLSADKESRLLQFANRAGKHPEQVVEEAVDNLLEHETHYVEAVEKGRRSVLRGDLLENDEVVERIARQLTS